MEVPAVNKPEWLVHMCFFFCNKLQEKSLLIFYPALLYSVTGSLQIDLERTFLIISFSKKDNHALISTSTPEGKSSFDNASTVLDEEV